MGGSHDTSEFACDSIWQWWTTEGQAAYPSADSLLLLRDGGGSNSSSQLVFKQDLQTLANRLGLEIRVAHAKTRTGLSVVANIINKVYETGRKVVADFKKTMRILFDNILPRFNYRAIPTTG